MIRNFVGAATLIAALFIPIATQAQGVPGGVEQGQGMMKERLGRSGQLLAEWSAASLVV